MQAFTKHRGIIAALDRANIDTDQIIAKQFLKSIKRTGYGESLFFDWRYLPDGKDNPDFILNAPRFKNASILVAKNNFGCGSSREHAVWAVVQYGFKVVIAPTLGDIPAFADIFYNNSSKNGLLCISLSESDVEEMISLIQGEVGLEASVDLEGQTILLHLKSGDKVYAFQIDPAVKTHLMRGLDDIGLTLEHLKDIETFEKNHNPQWV
ncbi:MAG: 3-isopropylmalate dehydratase small subunit [Deltaproteobacteria bacterium]|nr:3-isopropylmalate dehydratase small subunit [Deltaproteobacteria bacterium]